MPHILRDVNPIVATLLTQHHIFYDRAIIIVSSHSNLASQDNERLILRWVPMDGYHSPRLHGIQKPVALVLQRLMKIIVHSLPRRDLRLVGQVIKYCLVDNHPSSAPVQKGHEQTPLPLSAMRSFGSLQQKTIC